MVWTLLSLGESRPFYGRWIRRSIAQINETMPQRKKSEGVQAARALPPTDYTRLITCAGFQILEIRERRVLLSQAAVRAISSYRDFAMGALRAVDEDADAASQALQASLQPTFRDLRMKYLPRKWLEIIAVKVWRAFGDCAAGLVDGHSGLDDDLTRLRQPHSPGLVFRVAHHRLGKLVEHVGDRASDRKGPD